MTVVPHPPYSQDLMQDQNGFSRKDRKMSGSSYRKDDGNDCLEIWELQPPGTLRACPGL